MRFVLYLVTMMLLLPIIVHADGCKYVDDPRLKNIGKFLKDVKKQSNIDPLLLTPKTYISFSKDYVDYIGKNNIALLTKDCSAVPLVLGGIPVKVLMPFVDLWNTVIQAAEAGDEDKLKFIKKNFKAEPVDRKRIVEMVTVVKIYEKSVHKLLDSTFKIHAYTDNNYYLIHAYLKLGGRLKEGEPREICMGGYVQRHLVMNGHTSSHRYDYETASEALHQLGIRIMNCEE